MKFILIGIGTIALSFLRGGEILIKILIKNFIYRKII